MLVNKSAICLYKSLQDFYYMNQSSFVVVKQLLLLYVLLFVQHLNRLLEEPRLVVKCVCILYL